MAKAATKRAARRDDGPSIIEVMEDPDLLGSHFNEDAASWFRWKVALSAMHGLPPPKGGDVDALEFYRAHTGRHAWPTGQAKEAWLPIGVRGGKSKVAGLIATTLGMFRDYSPYLSRGEVGTLPVIAADRKQARTVFGYIKSYLCETPLFASLVTGEKAESIGFTNAYGNPIVIEVHTASFRSLRGYTCVGCVADEIAVWKSEGSANPDTEVITAIRSRFATIPNAMLVAISSPYARVGELWKTYERHFGEKGSPRFFVWQAATRDMNPSVPQEWIDEQYEIDPARAAAEYGGEFRTDVERFVPLEVVQACVPVSGREQNPPAAGVTYSAFVDPSGGRSDPMTLGIGHRKPDGNIVLDVLEGVKPPFQPAAAIAKLAAVCRPYRITKIYGDRYAGEFPREVFRNEGIDYVLHPKSRSELYVDLLPQLTSRKLELLDHPKLAVELTSLERRVSPAGREIIDHPKGGHDDHANVLAGVVALLVGGSGLSPVWGSLRR